ncbi:MAG: hypothetical protein JJU36_06245 [Phycisphaeraceae bacterium]|nr:hypothetical protein [Phycisphaeraceae bacterium]
MQAVSASNVILAGSILMATWPFIDSYINPMLYLIPIFGLLLTITGLINWFAGLYHADWRR